MPVVEFKEPRVVFIDFFLKKKFIGRILLKLIDDVTKVIFCSAFCGCFTRFSSSCILSDSFSASRFASSTQQLCRHKTGTRYFDSLKVVSEFAGDRHLFFPGREGYSLGRGPFRERQRAQSRLEFHLKCRHQVGLLLLKLSIRKSTWISRFI